LIITTDFLNKLPQFTIIITGKGVDLSLMSDLHHHSRSHLKLCIMNYQLD
jgi:hypothetical protein